MIRRLLFLTFLLLLSFIAADNSFKPTSGELILANQTYTMTWSFELPSPSCVGVAFSLADEVPPSYTTGLSVSSPFYSTMTQTGSQAILFTEINPTSTITAITMIYTGVGYTTITYILGPVTILTNPLTQTTPTVTKPATVTVVPTVTVDSVPVTVTKSSASLSTLVQPSLITSTSLPSQPQPSVAPTSEPTSTSRSVNSNNGGDSSSSRLGPGIDIGIAIASLVVSILTLWVGWITYKWMTKSKSM